MAMLLLLLVASTLSTCRAGNIPHQINAMPRPPPGRSCQSWRLAVETHNIIGWQTVPKECETYVSRYMLGHQYQNDFKTVIDEAIHHAHTLIIPKDGRSVWVFDVDETAISNLPYYSKHGFGSEPFNSTLFNKWLFTGEAPVLPETLRLYKEVLSLGIKVVFLTGRSDHKRAVTATNLKNAGYHTWEKLITMPDSSNAPAIPYKSSMRTNLEQLGYRIVGNIGDQWSDLLGPGGGGRQFKLPNAMYFVP